MAQEFFRRDILSQLMDGFDKLKDDENASIDFLKILREANNVYHRDMLLAAVMPIEGSQIYQNMTTSSDAHKSILRSQMIIKGYNKESVNDWVFFFSVCINNGVYSDTPFVLLSVFNGLCKGYAQYLDQADDLTKRRLCSLRDEIHEMHADRFYLDFSSPEEEVVLPPLSASDIKRFSDTGNELYNGECACYLIESERETRKLMRYFASVMNGHIRGYEEVSAEAARTLMCKSALAFRPQSAFLISEWFLGLCVAGDGQQAVRFFNQHKKVLLRPYRYPISSSKVYGIENYIEFINTPSRLCEAIAWSLKKGNSAVLDAFLNDSQVRVLLEQRRFIKQLCEKLDGPTMKIAAHAYTSIKSPNAKLFQSDEYHSVAVCHQHYADDNVFRMNEQVLIDFSLRRWDRYYDDRNVILRAISDARTHRKILAGYGYGYDLLVAERAVRIDKSSAQWIPPKIRTSPTIQAILNEGEIYNG